MNTEEKVEPVIIYLQKQVWHYSLEVEQYHTFHTWRYGRSECKYNVNTYTVEESRKKLLESFES